MKNKPVQKAISIIGNVAKTAREMGVNRAAIYWWAENGCPPDRVLKLESLTGNKITRYELRPDIYGPKP